MPGKPSNSVILYGIALASWQVRTVSLPEGKQPLFCPLVPSSQNGLVEASLGSFCDSTFARFILLDSTFAGLSALPATALSKGPHWRSPPFAVSKANWAGSVSVEVFWPGSAGLRVEPPQPLDCLERIWNGGCFPRIRNCEPKLSIVPWRAEAPDC